LIALYLTTFIICQVVGQQFSHQEVAIMRLLKVEICNYLAC